MNREQEKTSRWMVRITLSPAIQSKLSSVLFKLRMTSETYGVPLVLTLTHRALGQLLVEAAKSEELVLLLSQLNLEEVDLNKQPVRLVMKYDGMPYNEETKA